MANKVRNAAKRAKMTEEEKERIRAKDRERKARRRAIEEPQDEDEKDYNQKESKEYWTKVLAKDRKRKKKEIEARSEERKEFDRISQVLRMRKLRSKRSGKEHLLEKMKAQKGMSVLKNVGRYNAYKQRQRRVKDEMLLWRIYSKSNIVSKKIFEAKKPDIAEKFKLEEDELRNKDEEREKYRQEKRNQEGGSWEYDPCSGEYYWDGEGPPPDYNDDLEVLTPEELRDGEKQEKEWQEAYAAEMRLKKKEKMKEWRAKNAERVRECRQRQREMLEEPIDIPENDTISAYEQIRNDNLKELAEAKKASGLFECD